MKFVRLLLPIFFALFFSVLRAETEEPEEATPPPPPLEIQNFSEELWWIRDEIVLKADAKKDVFALANLVDLDGEYADDVWAAGRRVTFRGHAADDVRLFAAEVLTFDGVAEGGLRAISSGNMLVNTNSVVTGTTVLSAGRNLTVNGIFHGDLSASAPRLVLDAQVEGSLTLQSQDVTILPTSRVGGNLYYQSDTRPNAPDGVVAGEWIQVEPDTGLQDTLRQWRWTLRVVQLFTAFVIGLLMVRFLPRYTGYCVETMLKLQPAALMLGFFSTVVMGMCGYFLLLSVVGTGVGLFVLLLLSLLFYCGKIIAALALGATLVKHKVPLTFFRLAGGLFLGLLVLYALFAIPYAGTTLWVLVSSWGMGAMIQTIRNSQRVLKLEIPDDLREDDLDSTT
ncbi:MAG: polymer-forming cytoskeletal protein [Verrucomicrobia bacterium]|nr:polymer-forming cytoskeletal protein [Verrucomicrobiota bacterium]MCH8512744.1 polymer-forming cytoskeletal protein [Kiritimatiellia bacterium]